MTTHSSSLPEAGEKRRSAADARCTAQMKRASAVGMLDARASSLAQLQHQQRADQSGQAMRLRACAAMMADSGVAQRAPDDELLQGKFEKPNNTGLPRQLKSGIESLSGMSMEHVRVHYNSDKPAQLQAHAYAQGSEIHVAPGQEQHLPHEAWHVVQQAQDRVRPTLQMKDGVAVNDDAGLESEADLMGARALQATASADDVHHAGGKGASGSPLLQRMIFPVAAKPEDKAAFKIQGEKQSALGHGEVAADLSRVGPDEDLHVIGHGSENSVAGMTPEDLVALLLRSGLPSGYAGRIYLETCNSGTTTASVDESYAQRFYGLLNLEMETDVSVTGFAGSVLLDDAFAGRSMLRVLKKNVDIADFKLYARHFVEWGAGAIAEFLTELKKKGLDSYTEAQDFHDLHFLIYSAKIAKYAEPAGGGLTKLYVAGKEYQGISDAPEDFQAVMDRIEETAREKKAEIDAIPMLSLADLMGATASPESGAV